MTTVDLMRIVYFQAQLLLLVLIRDLLPQKSAQSEDVDKYLADGLKIVLNADCYIENGLLLPKCTPLEQYREWIAFLS